MRDFIYRVFTRGTFPHGNASFWSHFMRDCAKVAKMQIAQEQKTCKHRSVLHWDTPSFAPLRICTDCRIVEVGKVGDTRTLWCGGDHKVLLRNQPGRTVRKTTEKRFRMLQVSEEIDPCS